MGDAELAYNAYLTYGIEFIYKLNGAYAIFIYDKTKRSIFLVTDHMATRHLAYTVQGNHLYYSSTLHVISALLGKNLKLDEEWISAAYMDFAPDTEKLHGRSVYKNVFRVEPAHYIKITLNEKCDNGSWCSVESIEYWNPQKTVKPLELSSDEEYRKVFLETFRKSVKSMLRARKKHGILLSGGLDSSAVASIAADELSKSSKILYGYTQIPCEDYKYEHPAFEIENETSEVLKNREKYPNIECCFAPSRDLTSYREPEKYIRRFAQPVKPILNAPYFYSLDEEMKKDGISIVLTGGNGNATISYGNITTYIFQKSRGLHLLTAIKQAAVFCKVNHIDRPKLLKYYIKQRINSLKPIKDDGFIRNDLKEKYHLKKLIRNHFGSMGGTKFDSYKMWKKFIYMPLVRQHVSYFGTCQSLFTGAIYLDPTSSKEIIELCVSLPIDCFVGDGIERRAVRDYMKGIVNDSLLKNTVTRGLQAADYLFRANKYWDDTKDTLYNNLSVKELYAYFDRTKIDNLIAELKSKEYNMDKQTIAEATVASVLGCFLKNYKKFSEEEKWTEQKK